MLTCTTAYETCLKSASKIVSEYDQEIPQSRTADKPMGPTAITRHQEDKLSKTTSSLFPTLTDPAIQKTIQRKVLSKYDQS